MRTIIVIGILFCGLAKADMICKSIGDGEVLCRTVSSKEAPKEESKGKRFLKAFAKGLKGFGTKVHCETETIDGVTETNCR